MANMYVVLKRSSERQNMNGAGTDISLELCLISFSYLLKLLGQYMILQ